MCAVLYTYIYTRMCNHNGQGVIWRHKRCGAECTHLDESNEDDEKGRRAAGVVVGVVLPIALLRQELVADHADHPVNTSQNKELLLIIARPSSSSCVCRAVINLPLSSAPYYIKGACWYTLYILVIGGFGLLHDYDNRLSSDFWVLMIIAFH